MGVLDEFMNSCEEPHATALGIYRALRLFTNPDALEDVMLQIIYAELWYYGFGLVLVFTLPALLIAAAVGWTWGFSAGIFTGIIVWCAIYLWSCGGNHDPFFPTRKVLE
jgi:hypothetical protein